jgi:hypothetical protein
LLLRDDFALPVGLWVKLVATPCGSIENINQSVNQSMDHKPKAAMLLKLLIVGVFTLLCEGRLINSHVP